MKVVIRLDDYTPNRDVPAWDRVEAMLERHAVRPLVAVVPDDRYFGARATTETFWEDVRRLAQRGWAIGLHGDTHEVVSLAASAEREIFFAKKSEFVGLSFEAQLGKLTRAYDNFVAHGVRPVAFVPPNHGFDRNTVRALIQHGGMHIVSDGIALRPYRDRQLLWLPTLDWRVPRIPVGFRTVCLHPSSMAASELARLERDLPRIKRHVVSLEQIDPTIAGPKSVADKAFAALFRVYFNCKESMAAALHKVVPA